jgi:serpin B
MKTFLLPLSLVLACTGSPDDTGVPKGDDVLSGTLLTGSTSRELSPSTENLPLLAAENAAFSLELLRVVHAQEPGNQVISPWSLQVVMAQVHAGASGDAKTAIADTFGWSLEDAALNEAFGAADLAVAAHDDAASDPPVTLTSTNQIFVTTGYELGAPWLDTLSSWYGTGVQQMDFAVDPEGVAADINGWIAERTGDRIQDLVSANVIANSRMLLANALYFNASWEFPFAEESTTDAPFHLADGSEVSVPTMHGQVTMTGVQADGFLLVEVPFADAGTGLTMTIVLPDEGRFDEVLAGLDGATLAAAIAAEQSCEACTLEMPKFEVNGKPQITPALRTLGMEAAFGGAYDGISPGLTLTAVEQMGFVSVGEKGMEAAAATYAAFEDSWTEPPFGPVVLDRPFLWLVRENGGGAILFAGVVSDPR